MTWYIIAAIAVYILIIAPFRAYVKAKEQAHKEGY